MSSIFESRLRRLTSGPGAGLLRGGLIGLEKESLRVAFDGHMAQTLHPSALGSALTHPWITTDYSEALLEFVTPPSADQDAAMAFLGDVQAYVYPRIGEDMLWATSMPCVLSGDESIPIARYGTSNNGTMKHVYRRGLGYRYGRVMQVIAGVHFNYSVPTAFWPVYQDLEGDDGDPQDFISDSYIALIRNLQRVGWLIPYLFGASPAVCKSFFAGKESRLQEFDRNTYYQPYATSLRVSDIGYQNKKEKEGGLHVCYDDLDSYIDCLRWAIETPSPEYQKIGVVVDGEYRQLNANMLQIENEYYSSIRPKQIPERNQKPIVALRQRGVRYVELRSLDVNAYEPLGVQGDQLRFLEALLHYCLLEESPGIAAAERPEIDANLETAASRGREPGVSLNRGGQAVELRTWAEEICEQMAGICEYLDAGTGSSVYTSALLAQRAAITDSELTPSARILADMRANGESFYHLARRLSSDHRDHFMALTLDPETQQKFDRERDRSLQHQVEMERSDRISFSEFLERYFAEQL